MSDAADVHADMVLPDYGGGCLSNVVPAVLERAGSVPPWMPDVVRHASQVVLFVLDGVGWDQLQSRRHLAPFLTGMTGGPITSVVPSTTATALTSLAVGAPPGEHGIVGYRFHAGEGAILNVLRWQTAAGDAREAFPPRHMQPLAAFSATTAPVVTRAEFASTGFTDAHLGNARFVGWRAASSIAVEVRHLIDGGEPFVYAYYDGVDKIAHERGIGLHYDAELRAADRLVADIASSLPAGAVLLVTSDHGQVDVREACEMLDREIVDAAALVTGEARFRWLHARPGEAAELATLVRERYGDTAIVRTIGDVEAAGWFGPRLTDAARARLGDVAVVATGTRAYLDPREANEVLLATRHGGLSSAEMLVPLVAVRA